jgi:hypothetical protein
MSKKPGPPPEWNERLEIIIRHWPHLPDYVQRAMTEQAQHYGPARVAARFPTPAGATWKDVEIVLQSPSEAQITVGNVTRSYTFSALGLADGRSPKRPRIEWRMLRTYAENPESDAYYKLPYRDSLKVEISMFRRWLKAFFGLPGDPLRPFEPSRWLPRFKVRAEY